MNLYTIHYIKNSPLLYNYLREESHWYKELNRGSISLKQLENYAKKYYKETPEDKLKKLSDRIALINTFIDVIK